MFTQAAAIRFVLVEVGSEYTRPAKWSWQLLAEWDVGEAGEKRGRGRGL